MPEEVLFESERQVDRDAAADYLRTVADKLSDGGSVTLERGGEEITVDVPSSVEFEVKVEREGPADGPGEIGFELELEWPEDGTDDSLSVT
jgi:amphi-Trp domain-containing protein